MTTTYYNYHDPVSKVMDSEMRELDWMPILMPPSWYVAVGYVFAGTILARESSLLLKSTGQVLQILGFATFLRKLSRLYDSPDAGKGLN